MQNNENQNEIDYNIIHKIDAFLFIELAGISLF
jgi:hypothetical protein